MAGAEGAKSLPASAAVMPEGYAKQLVREWEKSRADLATAAAEGRAAQERWNRAIEREFDAHRRMREAMGNGR